MVLKDRCNHNYIYYNCVSSCFPLSCHTNCFTFNSWCFVLISLSIVGHLADKFNFPINTFTRTFIVVSLFGIGTDYNLLIISRFREELANGKNVDDAILTTYKTAGKRLYLAVLQCLQAFQLLQQHLLTFQGNDSNCNKRAGALACAFNLGSNCA